MCDAQKNSLTYAAIYLERLISDLSRQLPSPLDHVNQIVVLSFSGQIMNLMRGQGALYHHLLPAIVLAETTVSAMWRREINRDIFHRIKKLV